MDADAAVERFAGPDDHDLGVAPVPAEEAMQGGGGEVAEYRVEAARLDRGQEPALARRVRVPDGVDAAVEPMESARPRTRVDLSDRQSTATQVGDADDAPLLCGKSGDMSVRGHARTLAEKSYRDNTRLCRICVVCAARGERLALRGWQTGLPESGSG